MIEGIAKKKPKRDVCHSIIVLEILLWKWFPLEGLEPNEEETYRAATRGQEKEGYFKGEVYKKQ
jgi:hypothetical protein